MSEEGLRKEIMKDLIKEVYGPRNFNEESEISNILNNDPPADSEEAAIEQAFLDMVEEEPEQEQLLLLQIFQKAWEYLQ